MIINVSDRRGPDMSASQLTQSWLSVPKRLALRMLKAKLRRRANTPGLERMRERSSPKVVR